jgi:hypothetical protein
MIHAQVPGGWDGSPWGADGMWATGRARVRHPMRGAGIMLVPRDREHGVGESTVLRDSLNDPEVGDEAAVGIKPVVVHPEAAFHAPAVPASVLERFWDAESRRRSAVC